MANCAAVASHSSNLAKTWSAIYANQDSSAEHYEDIRNKLNEFKKDPKQSGFSRNCVAISDDEDDESEDEVENGTDDGDCNYADQGDIGKAPPRPTILNAGGIRFLLKTRRILCFKAVRPIANF